MCTTAPQQVEIRKEKTYSKFNSRLVGVFPIDGDCARFLMCRANDKSNAKIKGKVYRCPKGD